MSESGERRGGERRESAARSFLATLACAVGILLAVGAAIGALLGAGAAGVVSAGAVGVGLGVLAYLMGSNRLGTVTIIVSIGALFLGLVATQGLIPGTSATDRDLPAVEPRGSGD